MIAPVTSSTPPVAPKARETVPEPQDRVDTGSNETPDAKLLRYRRALLAGRRATDTIEQRWSVEGTSYGSPVCGGDLVFASRDQKQTVSALNMRTGATVWEKDIGGPTTPPLVSRHGLVFVGGKDRALHGYDPASGEERWTLPEPIGGRLMEDDQGTLYACQPGQVTAIDVDQKKVLWRAPVQQNFEEGPVVGPDGAIYGGDKDGTIYKLKPQSGDVDWSYPTGSMIRTRPVVDRDGSVYCGNIKGEMVAVKPDGTRKWAFPTKGFVLTPAALALDGAVVFGSGDNSIYSVDPQTGHQNWSFATNGEIRATPTPAADGMVYAVSDRNQIYGLDAASGNKLWDFQAGSYVHCPLAADGHGRVFYGCNNFRIYAHENPQLISRLAEAELHPPDAPPQSISDDPDDYLVIGDLHLSR